MIGTILAVIVLSQSSIYRGYDFYWDIQYLKLNLYYGLNPLSTEVMISTGSYFYTLCSASQGSIALTKHEFASYPTQFVYCMGLSKSILFT